MDYTVGTLKTTTRNQGQGYVQPGLYEQLLTRALAGELEALGDPRLYQLEELDPEDAHDVVAQHVERLLASGLSSLRGRESQERQQRLIDRIVATLVEELAEDAPHQLSIASPLQRLLAVHRHASNTHATRPDTPLARSALLTGTPHEPNLGTQLRKEIATADRIDFLCAFIRWSGLRIVLDELREFTARLADQGTRLRVITTTYMAATEPRAVDALSRLPATEVKVSYDTRRTRLHAKAYLFHRETGFSTAYVGSANLSKPALSEGLEWTTKISHYELPHLWSRLAGTFDSYWEDAQFESYDPERPQRLHTAIARETGTTEPSPFPQLDLHPYPFQEEILDTLAAEREIHGKQTHLIVAATGTGKTMIAAFDYRALCRTAGHRPRLLFIAHREEILKQALATYRAVLRDQNFGDLLVGSRTPAQMDHLFCSIQSYGSQSLDALPPDQYEVIVVDEFHHAAASSYRRLLDRVRPATMLGLTATPERQDGLDVLEWFGGRASAEIRLPDAIERRLLCPFQYFGVADSVDLDGLAWQRGGYRVEDLDRVYTGNDARANLVVQKVHEILLDPRNARGLGFCVSQAHARYMAAYFNAQGLPAEALTAESSYQDRHSVQQRLRQRDINFIFVVDLYNEGVDIPEVDTVLFLRPTESLTVYLQQLGRGLRLHDEKDCLTALDFIGSHRREFRFSPRFRALSARPTRRVDREVEEAFPHLPSGCLVRLERVAQQRILDNLKQSVVRTRPRLVAGLRDLMGYLGRIPTLEEALDYLDLDLDPLLRRGLWSRLLQEAGGDFAVEAPDEQRLAKGLRRLHHVDCAEQIQTWLAALEGGFPDPTAEDRVLREMLQVSLWGKASDGWTLNEAERRLQSNRSAVKDLKTLFEYRLHHAPTHHAGKLPSRSGPLTVHAQYTRDEILVGLGHWNLEKRPRFSEGVLHLPRPKVDAFFVTLNKTEAEYSPTTMYEDYLISRRRFHWQSQSGTSAESPTGQRYLNHESLGYTPLLFVREFKKLEAGLTAPYVYLGPGRYVSHSGSKPISIEWELQHPVPPRWYRVMARQAAG